MHVPEIGSGTVLQGLGNDLAQALGRKGVIRQASQRQPLEADLTTIALRPLPDRGKVLTEAMEDRLDLMEVAMDPMHGVILADVFAKVQKPLGCDLKAKLFQDFTAYGVAQRLAMILSAARQNEKLPFFGADTDRQDISAAKDDGAGRRPDARRSTTRLATRSGHEATLPGPAGQ
jgi:hypothetical protein